MAWRKLQLDQINPGSKWSVLVYGANAVGKTHLEGDAIRWAVGQGKKAWFINTAGEDGYATLAGLEGLDGFTAADVSSLDDFKEAVKAAKEDEAHLIAVDSLIGYSKLIWLKYFGEVRTPDATKDGTRSQMLWAHHRQDLENGVVLSRSAAPFVLWTATFDRTEDPLTGQKSKVSPDLYGKESLQCAGWFDFVGQMRAQTVGPGKVNRWVQVKPDESALTRQRLRRVITRDIPIPPEKGGWEALLTAAIEAARE